MATLLSLMTLRQNLARILTNAEMDNNFVNISNRIDSIYDASAGHFTVSSISGHAVYGNILFGAESPKIIFNSGGSTISNGGIGNTIIFTTNGTQESLRINSSGHLSIAGSGTGNDTLSVSNSGVSGAAVALLGNGATTPNKYIRAYNGALEILNSTLSAGIFTVYDSGNTYNATGVYGTISDIKLKDNIEPARSYLSDLLRVTVKKFNLKSDPYGQKQLGVIAQELEEIFPGMIDLSPDTEIKPSSRFEQKIISAEVINKITGEVIVPAVMGDDPERPIMETVPTGEVTKSVKYSVFVPMLITAIQELATRVVALEPK